MSHTYATGGVKYHVSDFLTDRHPYTRHIAECNERIKNQHTAVSAGVAKHSHEDITFDNIITVLSHRNNLGRRFICCRHEANGRVGGKKTEEGVDERDGKGQRGDDRGNPKELVKALRLLISYSAAAEKKVILVKQKGITHYIAHVLEVALSFAVSELKPPSLTPPPPPFHPSSLSPVDNKDYNDLKETIDDQGQRPDDTHLFQRYVNLMSYNEAMTRQDPTAAYNWALVEQLCCQFLRSLSAISECAVSVVSCAIPGPLLDREDTAVTEDDSRGGEEFKTPVFTNCWQALVSVLACKTATPEASVENRGSNDITNNINNNNALRTSDIGNSSATTTTTEPCRPKQNRDLARVAAAVAISLISSSLSGRDAIIFGETESNVVKDLATGTQTYCLGIEKDGGERGDKREDSCNKGNKVNKTGGGGKGRNLATLKSFFDSTVSTFNFHSRYYYQSLPPLSSSSSSTLTGLMDGNGAKEDGTKEGDKLTDKAIDYSNHLALVLPLIVSVNQFFLHKKALRVGLCSGLVRSIGLLLSSITKSYEVRRDDNIINSAADDEIEGNDKNSGKIFKNVYLLLKSSAEKASAKAFVDNIGNSSSNIGDSSSNIVDIFGNSSKPNIESITVADVHNYPGMVPVGHRSVYDTSGDRSGRNNKPTDILNQNPLIRSQYLSTDVKFGRNAFPCDSQGNNNNTRLLTMTTPDPNYYITNDNSYSSGAVTMNVFDRNAIDSVINSIFEEEEEKGEKGVPGNRSGGGGISSSSSSDSDKYKNTNIINEKPASKGDLLVKLHNAVSLVGAGLKDSDKSTVLGKSYPVKTVGKVINKAQTDNYHLLMDQKKQMEVVSTAAAALWAMALDEVGRKELMEEIIASSPLSSRSGSTGSREPSSEFGDSVSSSELTGKEERKGVNNKAFSKKCVTNNELFKTSKGYGDHDYDKTIFIACIKGLLQKIVCSYYFYYYFYYHYYYHFYDSNFYGNKKNSDKSPFEEISTDYINKNRNNSTILSYYFSLPPDALMSFKKNKSGNNEAHIFENQNKVNESEVQFDLLKREYEFLQLVNNVTGAISGIVLLIEAKKQCICGTIEAEAAAAAAVANEVIKTNQPHTVSFYKTRVGVMDHDEDGNYKEDVNKSRSKGRVEEGENRDKDIYESSTCVSCPPFAFLKFSRIPRIPQNNPREDSSNDDGFISHEAEGDGSGGSLISVVVVPPFTYPPNPPSSSTSFLTLSPAIECKCVCILDWLLLLLRQCNTRREELVRRLSVKIGSSYYEQKKNGIDATTTFAAETATLCDNHSQYSYSLVSASYASAWGNRRGGGDDNDNFNNNKVCQLILTTVNGVINNVVQAIRLIAEYPAARKRLLRIFMVDYPSSSQAFATFPNTTSFSNLNNNLDNLNEKIKCNDNSTYTPNIVSWHHAVQYVNDKNTTGMSILKENDNVVQDSFRGVAHKLRRQIFFNTKWEKEFIVYVYKTNVK